MFSSEVGEVLYSSEYFSTIFGMCLVQNKNPC